MQIYLSKKLVKGYYFLARVSTSRNGTYFNPIFAINPTHPTKLECMISALIDVTKVRAICTLLTHHMVYHVDYHGVTHHFFLVGKEV